jgi:hypothetical protein
MPMRGGVLIFKVGRTPPLLGSCDRARENWWDIVL